MLVPLLGTVVVCAVFALLGLFALPALGVRRRWFSALAAFTVGGYVAALAFGALYGAAHRLVAPAAGDTLQSRGAVLAMLGGMLVSGLGAGSWLARRVGRVPPR
jgi:hypothetical protein